MRWAPRSLAQEIAKMLCATSARRVKVPRREDNQTCSPALIAICTP
jgi:hypothetical protein